MVELATKNECTGCGACELACKFNAIKIHKDSLGYSYPVIDYERCVGCRACERKCHAKNHAILSCPETVYAFQTKDISLLKDCGSGGFFSELSSYYIKTGGLVYGVAMNICDSRAEIKHIQVKDLKDICKIRGSKYAISNTGNSYKEIKALLEQGTKVLFSGTPCQVAGLKAYLGMEYDNLLTLDIFCHGNSPVEIFNKYLDYLSNKYHADIVDYCFRNKEKGVGFRPQIRLSNGKVKNLFTYQEGYWYLCQFSKINMESCYSCNYSSDKRCGDISIGDFWGIEKVRPDLLPSFNTNYGISAVVINSSKGKEVFDNLINGKEFTVRQSTLAEVKQYGAALRDPNAKPIDYNKVFEMIKNESFGTVISYSKRQLGLLYYKTIVYDILTQCHRNKKG